MVTKEAVKEVIKEVLSNEFDYYTSEALEVAWKRIESELGLKYWEDGLYRYRKSKDVWENQKNLREKVKEIAKKYGLNEFELWENHVIPPAEMLNNSFSETMEKEGLKDAAEYVSVGYDDREGGFFVAVDSDVVSKLLDADVDNVIEKFLNGISEEELEQLEQKVLKNIEEGDEQEIREVLEEVVRDFLEEQKETLTQSYVEECPSIGKFIKVVEKLEKDLAVYLSDVDYFEENIMENIENYIETSEP